MTDKACRKCKMIIKAGNECPICKDSKLTTNWKGFVQVFDKDKSVIAQANHLQSNGKFALRLGK